MVNKTSLLDYFKQVYNTPVQFFSISRNTNTFCDYLIYSDQLSINIYMQNKSEWIITKNATKQRIDELKNLLEILRNKW